MPRTIWTDKEIDFLKANYATKGAKYVGDQLDRSVCAVRSIALRYRLKSLYHTDRAKALKILKEHDNGKSKDEQR